MTTKTPLPNPCRVCGGVVLYGGRGRRPVYCGPACKASTDAESRPLRREAAADPDSFLARDLADDGSRPEVDGYRWSLPEDVLRDEARSAGDVAEGETLDDFEALGFLPDGYVVRDARSRRKGADPAAEWLREHAPEALAEFGSDY